RVPERAHNTDEKSAGAVPLLGEMEDTVALIPQTFAGSGSTRGYLSSEDLLGPELPVAASWLDAKHSRFALKGCLAATACYVIYNVVDWPGIRTSVTTCLLTALSTVGASRQKQVLRLTGAIAGGLLIGMGSQVFILPHIDSITGFLVLFVLVT